MSEQPNNADKPVLPAKVYEEPKSNKTAILIMQLVGVALTCYFLLKALSRYEGEERWIIILSWLFTGMIAAAIGSHKGQATVGMVVGFLLGPFGIVAMLMTKGNRLPCQFCKEMIHQEAITCPRCHKDNPITTTTQAG